MRVELSKEDPGSIAQADGGVIEITIPSSTPTQSFAQDLKAQLETMGYKPGQLDEEEEDDGI